MWNTYNRQKIIKGISEDMQLIMKSCFNSILSVQKNYLYWTISGDRIKKKNYAYVERAFAYELYFQWNIDDTIYGSPMYKNRKNIKINAEIRKEFMERLNTKSNYGYPDLVLHKGNGSGRNYIICEIKRKETVENDKSSLIKDINKLGFFLRDDIHVKNEHVNWKGYKYGLFLLTGQYFQNGLVEIKEQDIEDNIDVSAIKVKQELQSRIICAIYNGKKLKYTNLKDLIENKQNNE